MEQVAVPRSVFEAGVGQHLQHLRWSREAGDRRGEVAVGGALARDEAADEWQTVVQVKVVGQAVEARGVVAFEYADLAAGHEHAMDFAQGLCVVGQVAEAEGGRYEVERIVRDKARCMASPSTQLHVAACGTWCGRGRASAGRSRGR